MEIFRTMRNVRTKLSEHPCVILFLLMAATALVIFHPFLSGANIYAFEDTCSDTVQQYLPYMGLVVNKLKAGDLSFWEFNIGYGLDVLNSQSWLLNPFFYPLYAIGCVFGKTAMFRGLVWIQLAECFLVGFLCFDYLKQFQDTGEDGVCRQRFSDTGMIAASYCCSFCGFILLWGEHYIFSAACVFLILIINLMERCITGKGSWLMLTLAVAASLIFSLYLSYPTALAGAGYLLFRLGCIWKDRGGAYSAAVFGKMILFVAVAAMISAAVTLPAYYQLTQVTTRISEGASLLEKLRSVPLVYDSYTLQKGFVRFFSNNLLGSEDYYQGPLNYVEHVQLFFSLLFLPFCVLLLAEGILYTRTKVRYIAAGAAVLLLLICPMAAFAFNMFAGLATRFTYILIPLGAYVIAWGVTNIKRIHAPVLLILWPVTIWFIYMVRHQSGILSKYHMHAYKLIVMGLLLGFALLVTVLNTELSGIWKTRTFGWIRKIADQWGTAIVVAILVLSMTWDGYYTLCCRKQYPAASVTENSALGTGTQKCLYGMEQDLEKEALGDSLYRVDKTYRSMALWNDSWIEDYSGVSYYNTTYNSNVRSFIDELWPQTWYYPDMLQSNFVVFRNDYDNVQMASLVGIQYIVGTQDDAGTVDGYEETYAGPDELQLYENRYAGDIGILFDHAVTEEDIRSIPVTEIEKRQDELAVQVVMDEVPEGFGADGSDRTFADDPAYYSRNSVEFFKQENDGTLTAETELDRKRLLLITVPYDVGWTAFVNGQEARIYRGDLGFQVLLLPEGHSSIQLVYQTPWMRYGGIISGAGILLFTWMVVMSRRKNRGGRKIEQQ